MKSKLIFLSLFLYTSLSFAKEGMWLPFLLEKMNEKEMKGMGCMSRVGGQTFPPAEFAPAADGRAARRHRMRKMP